MMCCARLDRWRGGCPIGGRVSESEELMTFDLYEWHNDPKPEEEKRRFEEVLRK